MSCYNLTLSYNELKVSNAASFKHLLSPEKGIRCASQKDRLNKAVTKKFFGEKTRQHERKLFLRWKANKKRFNPKDEYYKIGSFRI